MADCTVRLLRGSHQTSTGGIASTSSCLRIPLMAPRVRGGFRRTASTIVHYQRATKAPADMANKKVKLSFKLPYRVNFGQDICIVGSSEALGNWDPKRGVGMRWSEGDVWQVDFEVSASPQLELEYKYVVRNADGGVSLWKPGSNYSFNLTPVAAGTKQVLPGGVAVRDAWDGSVRDVKVEVLEEGKPARPMTDAEREQNAFRESLVSALEELSAHIEQAEEVGGNSGDPTAPDVLQADRLVAAATRKAVAVAHALNAAQAQSRLAAPADLVPADDGGEVA